MSDYEEDEGRLMIDDRLDTSGEASQLKADESAPNSQGSDFTNGAECCIGLRYAYPQRLASDVKKEADDVEEGQIIDKADDASEVVVEQGRVPFNPMPIADNGGGVQDAKRCPTVLFTFQLAHFSNSQTDIKPFDTAGEDAAALPVKPPTPAGSVRKATPKIGKQDSEEYASDKDNVGVKNFLPTSSSAAKPPRPKKKKVRSFVLSNRP